MIFMRFPEAGKTKTRLIPRLGTEGAALLQRQMSEYTIAQVERLDRAVRIEIHYAGGTRQQMQDWLGNDRVYREQNEGDLGERLNAAFVSAFGDRVERAIAIGIDCPDLNAELLNEAFEQLKLNDLVLGKAADGGYYLIGLRCSTDLQKSPQSQAKDTICNLEFGQLFEGIAWGNERVLAQTVAIAKKLGYAIAYLPLLHDVDYPEDLPIWENRKIYPD
ncbi:TIGR04282 family arsenosugar biosynthesis glycosyltransferase [Oscillatoria sp. FACHB-1406]|nr:TIGR04282 family arsenosugar biosynthesis glycosyltransferase [Oscillatoria sp. FACHB-1406]MBD2577610.1 TIGR04282 family arsenosugar biosynthesis glycosyltransferase [Oscillatoria sp. FACHB-1406]